MELPPNLVEIIRELARTIRSGTTIADDELKEALRALHDAIATGSSAAPPKTEDLAAWLDRFAQDPNDTEARGALESIEQESRRLNAWDRVVEVLLARLEAIPVPAQRAQLLCDVAQIFEREVGDLAKAYATLSAALRESYPNQEISKDLERLAQSADLWAELLVEYEHLAPTIKEPKQQQAEWLRIAGLYRTHLAQTDGAIAALTHARKIDPTHPEVLQALAEALREGRRYKELAEVTVLEAGIHAELPERTSKLLLAADLFETRVEDLDRALALYEQACALDETNRAALEGLERIYRRRELWEPLVRTLLRKANVASNEEAVSLRLEMASLCDSHLEDPQAAVGHARAVLASSANDMRALLLLEGLYDKLGQTEQYLEILAKRVPQLPAKERIPLFLRLATEWEDLNRARAAEFLEQALAIDERCEEALRLLVRILRTDQQTDALVHALERYERIATDTRARAEALAELARTYERLEKHAEALCALEKLAGMESGPARAALHVRMGLLLRDRLGETGRARAEEELVRALEFDPTQVPARLALAEVYRARGDGLRAAKALTEAAETSRNHLERVRAFVEAAELYDEAQDHTRAVELLRRALAEDPEHIEAARRLVGILESQGKAAEVRPLLELLRRKTHVEDRPGLADLHLRLARAAVIEGREQDALREYLAAHALEIRSTEVLQAIADLGEKTDALSDARQALTALLLQDTTDGRAQKATRVARLARLHERMGDTDQAIQWFSKAVEEDPNDRASLRSLTEIYRQRQDFAAVVRVLLAQATLDDREESYRCYVEIAELRAEKLGDKAGAAEALRQAAIAQPKRFTPLHRLLDLATERRDWKEVLDVLGKLAAMEEDRERRAHYWYSAAVVLRDELHDEALALEYLEKCLDDDPQRSKAPAGIEGILRRNGRWADLEKAYTRQIERLGVALETAEARASLWNRLGELRQAELHDRKGAVAAYEEATTCDPGNVDIRRRLTALYGEMSGPIKLDSAIPAAQAHLRVDPYRAEAWRLLARLYDTQGQSERAEYAASALALLGLANEDERARVERIVPLATPILAHAPHVIDETRFARLLRHPDEDSFVSRVFAIIAPVSASLTARPPASYGLAHSPRIDTASEPGRLVVALREIAPLFGSAIPDLYLDETGRGLRPANPRNGVGYHVALILGRDVAYCDSDTEARFEATRGLVLARPEYLLAWAVPFVPALRSLLWAALSLGRSTLAIPADVEEFARTAAHLRKNLTADAIARLAELANALESGPTGPVEPDLGRWLAAVELTVARAGFAMARDLTTAARIVASDPAGLYSLPAKERVKELLVYAVSDEYFDLRASLDQ